MTETVETSVEQQPMPSVMAGEIIDPNASPEVPEECRPVLTALELEGQGSGSWVKTLLILGLSLLIFFNLGLLNNGLSDMLVLVVVLFIHELGHYVGMKWFGYRDVKMFFIPFFGAAVSGKSVNVSMAKKAIIAMLGPVPGLVAGTVLSYLYLRTGDSLYKQFAWMFVIINAFNLLPIYPLDGGRFFHEILFSRHPALQAISRVIASLALMGLGVLLKTTLLTILGIIGLLNFKSLGVPFKIRRIARELQPAGPPGAAGNGGNDPGAAAATRVSGIPLDIAVPIIQKVRGIFPPTMPPKLLARFTLQVWEKMTLRPPGISATLGLMGLYFVVLVAPLSFLAVAMFESNTGRQIVKFEKPDGTTGQKEQFMLRGKVLKEVEFDPARNLYQGRQVCYLDGKVCLESSWCDGLLDGECKVYDKTGKLVHLIRYAKGKPVSNRILEKGDWVNQTPDSLPFSTRIILGYHNGLPEGPKVNNKTPP